ncbi:hypothetical protein [Pararhodobacter sp. CCB-MM2]|uniref:hypothetical protein n=1 Tax=Pararhodobacter sp. CCB-MM2 TaxID=1786003 RepID=UPI00131418A3|nr:hypothetical protein [Pararhodobacter sp. CCB-MM2]
MIGILNATFRTATRSESWPDSEKPAVRRQTHTTREWFDETPRNPRTGLRPGESWTDRG